MNILDKESERECNGSSFVNLPPRHEIFGTAFEQANNFVAIAVRSIVDMLVVPSVIHFKFADLKAVACSKNGKYGSVQIGIGKNALQAARHILKNQHLNNAFIGATGYLVNISAGEDSEIVLPEIMDAINAIGQIANDVPMPFGYCFNAFKNILPSYAWLIIVFAFK